MARKAKVTIDNTVKQSDDFKVVMATDHSTTGDAVVVFPTVKTIKDLKGKKVASLPGAYGELFVTTMLSQNNMKPSDILWVQIGDENEGVKLFLDKKLRRSISGNHIFQN